MKISTLGKLALSHTFTRSKNANISFEEKLLELHTKKKNVHAMIFDQGPTLVPIEDCWHGAAEPAQG